MGGPVNLCDTTEYLNLKPKDLFKPKEHLNLKM